MADHAVCIGPPAAAESYLRIPNVVAAAETTGCEAVHPGFGFLSENPAFVRACTESDLVFIGPPAEVMEKTGDKARAKAEMRAAGVPLVPGTEGVASLAEITGRRRRSSASPCSSRRTRAAAARACVSSPSPAELEAAYGAASAEAEAAFGDGSLYLEQALVPARHVEIQVLCDAPRRRAHARRARVLDSAPPPEADRGVAVAGPHARDARGDGGVGRARLQTARLCQRGNVRVPARPRRRSVVHRGQLPPAGRASRHRADDGHRHRPRAAPDRGRRAR